MFNLFRPKYFTPFMCVVCAILWIVTGVRQMGAGNPGYVENFVFAAVFAAAAVAAWIYFSKRS